jgi:hypothetical protein
VKPSSYLLLFPLLVLMLFGVACQRVDINNPDAVRQAVVAHIESRGDLNLAELDVSVRNTSFEGNECRAEVLFVPKGEAPENGMTMQYALERVGDAWKVRPQMPSMPSAPMEGGTAGPMGMDPSGTGLPAGHPPVPPPAAEPR